MDSDNPCEATKMFDRYLHDYMKKKSMHASAELFKKEANVCDNHVVIDSSEGLLSEWWSIFYDVYVSRMTKEANGEASFLASQMVHTENKNVSVLDMETFQRNPGKFPMSTDFDTSLGQSPNVSSEQFPSLSAREFDPNLPTINVNTMSCLKLAATMSSQSLENRQSRMLERNTIMDPTIFGIPKAFVPSSRLDNPVLNDGVILTPLEERPRRMSNYQPHIQTPTNQHQQPGFFNQLLSSDTGEPTPSFPETHKKITSCDMNLIAKDNIMDASDCCKDTEENKQDNEIVDSFLSKDENHDPDAKSLSCKGPNQQSPSQNSKKPKGVFSFEQIGSLHPGKNKLLCCHFSSGGNYLVTAGLDKKVFVCNMTTYEVAKTIEVHADLISDVRFRPTSTVFATSSFDRTVKLWDAAKSGKSLSKLLGHSEQVTSIDFHPWKVDLLCSCDNNDEIRFWDVKKSTCSHISKGATRLVRFQPRLGQLLATAARNRINLIDVETGKIQFFLEGHVKAVRSLCWDSCGKYIASVSEDNARVWSVASRKCVYELSSDGTSFQSCTFHPGYLQLLAIGSYKTLKLWNPTESSKTVSVPAHDGFITGLSDSRHSEMIASVSHDQCVKIWK